MEFISGLFLLDKPPGPTSHDAVLWARRAFGTPRVGHCGSLDPFASGLLLIVLGETLKWQDRLMAERKVYRGQFRLGLATDTDDATGKPLSTAFPRRPESVTEEELRRAFASFQGTQEQRVPLYSAVKVRGRRLYEWARKGEPVELPVKTVEIHRFDFLGFTPPDASFEVDCSKGTYVRSLARDLGEKLGTGATLQSLSRESIGSYLRSDAYIWKGERDVRREDLQKAFLPHHRLLAARA